VCLALRLTLTLCGRRHFWLEHFFLEFGHCADTETDHPGNFDDAMASFRLVRVVTGATKPLDDCSLLGGVAAFALNSLRTRFMSMLTRSLIISRSNSANTPSI
jgi:hypothetical protein